jgi:hypothetical protein
MDKTLRNVMIFAGLILVIATVFTVTTLSKRASSNGSAIQTLTNSGVNVAGNNANTPTNTATTGDVQNVKLSVSGGSYVLTPSVLKKGVPVRMEADLATVRGCSRDVVISAFGVRKYVKDGDNIITFTPTQTGIINIACSMNMYRGTFTVVDDGSASTGANLQAASPAVQSQTTPTTATLDSTPNTGGNGGGCTMGANGGGCGCGASTGGCGCGG